jgi:hypothetical protein
MSGVLQPFYRKALIDEMLDNVKSNTSYYYAVASNPIERVGPLSNTTADDYNTQFESDWLMLFGKKLIISNFAPLIDNNIWANGVVYRMYDNNDANLYSNNKFYVISTPDYTGGSYDIYKCIDNANNSPSTVKPSIPQVTSFETSDGYVWKYITSVPYRVYKMFSTNDYAPVYANSVTSLYANVYCGVEKVVISNAGSGYSTYHDGIILSANSTVVQVGNTASNASGFYTNSAIYIYNTTATTSQIFQISNYVSNSVGKWVYLEGEANTTNIVPEATQYKISPRVVFVTDGGTQPSAYSLVNTSTNSISDIVMLDIGADVSWANVYITSSVGSGVNVYAIVPPPGGHGSDPVSELNVKALGINFHFANSEISTIPDNILYNKVGIIKNPYGLYANGAKSNVAYTSATFSQTLEANLLNPVLFTVGDRVYGNTSNAYGIVAFANTSRIKVVGDKTFTNGEYVLSSDSSISSEIDIIDNGSIYAKDIKPLYVQDINNVNRSNSQTESFKLVIEI